MTELDIAYQRLHNQKVSRSTFTKPEEVVRWMGAVQAQDYLYSLWAIGLRMQYAIAADVEQAIADRTILRTWPMRGSKKILATYSFHDFWIGQSKEKGGDRNQSFHPKRPDCCCRGRRTLWYLR